MLLVWIPLSLAEGPWIDVGGAVGGTADVAPGAVASDTQAQVEVSGGAGAVTFLAQLDVHVDPLAGEIVTPWAPQEASVRGQFGAASVTAGVFNPQMSFEDWDPWANYLPAFSVLFNAAQPGQVAGANLGLAAGPGEAFVYGGTDLSWGWPADTAAAPTFGAGYVAETDTWGTWSGVAAYPTLDLYGAFLAGEVYFDVASVALDGGVGTSAGAPWAALQGYVVALPEALVRPTVRLEGVYEKDGALGAPHDLRASLGAVAVPVPWLHVGLEGAMLHTPEGWSPAATLSLTGRTPAEDDE